MAQPARGDGAALAALRNSTRGRPLGRTGAHVALGLLSAIVLALITWLVYYDGGSVSIYVELYYIPIVLAAHLLGAIGGVATALGAALLAGPFMPQQVQGAVPQPLASIAVRAVIFYCVAILISHLSETLRLRAQESESLFSISRAASQSLRLDEVLHTIAEKAVEITGASACVIRMLNAAGQELRLVASYGLSEEHQGATSIRLADSEVARRVLEGETIAVRDARTDPRTVYPELVRAEGLVSSLTLPLRYRERPLGVLRVYSDRVEQWPRRDRELLGAFASAAAVAVENARLYEDLRNSYLQAVQVLARAIEARDPYTRGHSERLARYALDMGRELALPAEELEALRIAAILHDIGKIGLAETVLSPQAREQADSEEVLARMHPLIGMAILRPAEFLARAVEGVRHHHERYDGQGYPDGLAGEQIPLISRIVAVANSFDLLTTPYPGRSALSQHSALATLRQEAGKAFDPEVVEALARSLSQARHSASAAAGA